MRDASRTLLPILIAALLAAGAAAGSANLAQDSPSQGADSAVRLPRGKKLILRDGTFQLVRSYERNGDRVRYYSAERGAWEELPTALVDWDATAKAEAAQKSEEEALSKKISVEEEARRAEMPLDVDVSLPVAPGVFLPPAEGMFVVDGRAVTQLDQVETDIKTDKKQRLKQVIVPIPIVSGKQNLEIPGAQAKVRVRTLHPEFYLREAPPDPDRTTPIRKSTRPGEGSAPEIELIRAAVKGNKRQVASIRSLFGRELGTEGATVSIQRWDVASNLFRFTLSQPLEPGEYVLAEITSEGMNLYVWDFGVDRAPAQDSAIKPPANSSKPR